MAYDSREDTLAHIDRVRSLVADIERNLRQRAKVHDRSKLNSPEKEMFDVATTKLKEVEYGSPEYKQSLKELGPALQHHYEHNSHHPEHWQNGIRDMSLLDLIEMLADWKAAGERHANGSMKASIDKNRDRFFYDDILMRIFHNTAREMGWED